MSDQTVELPASTFTTHSYAELVAVDVVCEDGWGGVSDGAMGDLFRHAADVIDAQGSNDRVFIAVGFESDDERALLRLVFE